MKRKFSVREGIPVGVTELRFKKWFTLCMFFNVRNSNASRMNFMLPYCYTTVRNSTYMYNCYHIIVHIYYLVNCLRTVLAVKIYEFKISE